MATSGSATAAINSHHQLLFEWSRSSYSNTENYSVISWSMKLKALTEFGSINCNDRTWSVTVNGESYSGTNNPSVSAGYGSKTLASGSTKITHDEWNKAQDFSYSFNQVLNVSLSGTTYNTIKGSGTGSLTKISPKTYTVSYSANGGSGAPSSQTKTHGTDLRISSTVPTKTGYTFKRWVSTRAGQNFYFNPGSTTAFNGDQELIAEWEENILTVNYYSGGATRGTLYEEEIQDLTALLGVSEFKYFEEESNGLWDVQWETWLYLEKQNYKPTGYWLYGEQRIDQSWPCTGQQLAESLGLDISSTSLSIDVVPEWERAASVITVYNEAGQPLRGVVHMYNSSGNLCYGIVTVYDENGIGRLAV